MATEGVSAGTQAILGAFGETAADDQTDSSTCNCSNCLDELTPWLLNRLQWALVVV